ncbi:MAG: hypothetical protein D3925_13565, partial [Candidatus Electrothrix sp. AR5]|nr:hypothetical protein [Candidatus Electrothrix sp. AR5]
GGGEIGSYYYDPYGRRLWKEVAGVRTCFYYNDEGLAGEYDATGEELRIYGYHADSPWSTNPLFVAEGGEYYWYRNDHLGTPQKITAQNGTVVWEARYDAFGEAMVLVDAVENNLRFPGQYFDAETGLYYNWHRYYEPGAGRYVTADPIGLSGGINSYVYVGGDSVNYIDPTGELAITGTILVVWAGVEIALSIYDAWDTGSTILDPCKSGGEKITSAVLFVVGMALPGGGYSKVDDIAKAAKSLGDYNRLYKSALGQFKKTDFTNAGRAVTKHPEYFGFKNTEALRKVYNTDAKINKIAADTLKDIMRTGKTTTGAGGRYPNGWKTITAPDGRAASWHADGRFIGFRGVE